MLRPVNHVDLFDALYPEHQLSGLADDSQLSVDEINARLAVIRANNRSLHRALNGMATAMPDGNMIREFVKPFHELAAHRRFVLNATQIANSAFRSGFDSAGEPLNLVNAHTVFPMNDLGGALIGDENFNVLVFSDGLLVPRSAVVTRAVQGGIMVYVLQSYVKASKPVDVAIHRKFSQFGVTHSQRLVKVAGSAVASQYTFTISDKAIYGLNHSADSLRVFHRPAGNPYYRPVSRAIATVREADGGDDLIVTVRSGAGAGDEFTVLCAGDYWESYREAAYTTTSNGTYKVSLVVPSTGGYPASVWSHEDLDVYVNGYIMIPGIDFYVEWNYDRLDLPPQLVVRNVIAPPGAGVVTILATSSAPYDPKEVAYRARYIQDAAGVIDMPPHVPGDRVLRLIPDMGRVTANRKLVSYGPGVETVAGNRGLYLRDLGTRWNVDYRLRLFTSKEAMDVLTDAGRSRTPVDELMELTGELAVDPVAQYKETYAIRDISLPAARIDRLAHTQDPGTPLYFYLEPGANPIPDGLGPARANSLAWYDFCGPPLQALQAAGQPDHALDFRDGAAFATDVGPDGSLNWGADCRPLSPDVWWVTANRTMDCRDR